MFFVIQKINIRNRSSFFYNIFILRYYEGVVFSEGITAPSCFSIAKKERTSYEKAKHNN